MAGWIEEEFVLGTGQRIEGEKVGDPEIPKLLSIRHARRRGENQYFSE